MFYDSPRIRPSSRNIEKENNQIITFYPEHLEAIDDFDKDFFTNGVFTADVAIIITDDYISFFKKN